MTPEETADREETARRLAHYLRGTPAQQAVLRAEAGCTPAWRAQYDEADRWLADQWQQGDAARQATEAAEAALLACQQALPPAHEAIALATQALQDGQRACVPLAQALDAANRHYHQRCLAVQAAKQTRRARETAWKALTASLRRRGLPTRGPHRVTPLDQNEHPQREEARET